MTIFQVEKNPEGKEFLNRAKGKDSCASAACSYIEAEKRPAQGVKNGEFDMNMNVFGNLVMWTNVDRYGLSTYIIYLHDVYSQRKNLETRPHIAHSTSRYIRVIEASDTIAYWKFWQIYEKSVSRQPLCL